MCRTPKLSRRTQLLEDQLPGERKNAGSTQGARDLIDTRHRAEGAVSRLGDGARIMPDRCVRIAGGVPQV